ncbi:MAG: glycosyltransferase family 4 protein [Deltaproteobacteria bacterium]|nr:glycosyltransferase family 4 protein [Deltaproteobacteria bacterium]
MKKTPGLVAKMLGRQFYSPHVYKKLRQLIRDTRPDVAYVLHFLKRMSPSVIDACADEGVPAVVRLSDFGLICANNIFFRDGKICQLCEKNQKYGLKYRCVKGSFFASTVRYLAHRFHELRGVFKKIDALVCPSKFMKEVFNRNSHFGEIPAHHLPTFTDFSVFDAQQGRPSFEERAERPYGIYQGRLEYEKGVDLIVDALKLLRKRGVNLGFKFIGKSNDPAYEDKLKSMVADAGLNDVEFCGFLDKERLFGLMRGALISVVPSRWVDNMPNSLIESQAMGLPVVASNQGCFLELIEDRVNGMLFDSDSAADLAEKMEATLADRGSWEGMSERAERWVRDYCSADKHYRSLMEIFTAAVER